MSEQRSVVSITIPSGASVSNAIDCNERSVIGFVAPAAWTTAALNIEASMDGINWMTAGLLDSTNAAAGSWPALTAGAGYSVDLSAMLPWQFVRFRSGTATAATNQAAARTFSVVTRPLA